MSLPEWMKPRIKEAPLAAESHLFVPLWHGALSRKVHQDRSGTATFDDVHFLVPGDNRKRYSKQTCGKEQR